MNHLKKIEDRVISILKTNVDARSDDMMLYLLVCNSFYSNENSVGKMPFEVVMKNYKELDIPVTVITEADCIPDHYKNDINGKIIAINPAILKPEYQRADRQLYYVTGGFGASANSRGSAVFCKNLYDGKTTRYERMDVLGEIKPERMPDWAKEKAAAFSRTIQGKDHER